VTDDHEAEYGLVMPFVVCDDNGGPLDAHSFVCGVRYGALAERLALPWLQGHSEYVEPDLVAQLDLLAMHLGWVMEVTPWGEHPDEWVFVSFARPSVPSEDGSS
jgi:hypothetical protein